MELSDGELFCGVTDAGRKYTEVAKQGAWGAEPSRHFTSGANIENSESVGGKLFETLVDYGKKSYSSQVWSGQWR